jgi:hypothetical protein
VKALAELGVKACTCIASSTAGEQPRNWNRYCAEVHYYARNMGKHQLLNGLPYVVH